jgi:hypothetical protein
MTELTPDQRWRLYVHDAHTSSYDAFADVGRWRDECLFPMQARIRACDPHTEVYSDSVAQEMAAAWGRWVETRHRVLSGRQNLWYAEVLDGGYALTADAPRSVTPLAPDWVEFQATQVMRASVERARLRLSRERASAIQMQITDIRQKLALLERRDFWLEAPFSAECRQMLAWFEWAQQAYRGVQ